MNYYGLVNDKCVVCKEEKEVECYVDDEHSIYVCRGCKGNVRGVFPCLYTEDVVKEKHFKKEQRK